jgi:transcriptional regulator with GAF, ATPase, and Fis domain
MSNQDMGLRTVFVSDRATSRRLSKVKLVVLDGTHAGKSFEIAKSRVYVGRARVNDVCIEDNSISSTHFELRAEEDGFLLRDLGSTNGTRLGGCRVREVWLEPEVSFRAGNTTFKLSTMGEDVEIPLSPDEHFGGVIGRSVAMREVFATLGKVAPSELTCLIEGETGTGKERVARAIHEESRRKSKPYVVLDCSSIPRDLMESYVFGHEKGAFTGAISQSSGAFEQANGGTLFLDEIGELDISLQPKLLRVLENREFKRVGGAKTVKADCRVLAATNRDLRAMVNEGTFREDLYFRLSIVNVLLPPLRGRRDDIPLLVEHFLKEVIVHRPDRPQMRLTASAMDMLLSYDWPGNVRELRNVIVRAANLAPNSAIEREDLQLGGARMSALATELEDADSASTTRVAGRGGDEHGFSIDISDPFKEAKQELVERFEIAYLERLMEAYEGNISQASSATGLTRYHLRELLKKYDLK